MCRSLFSKEEIQCCYICVAEYESAGTLKTMNGQFVYECKQLRIYNHMRARIPEVYNISNRQVANSTVFYLKGMADYQDIELELSIV